MRNTDRARARWFAARVVGQICDCSPITVRQLFGRQRTASVARARKLAYYLTRETSGASWPAIGAAFRRGHDTCLRGARSFVQSLDSDRHARALLADVLGATCTR